MKRTIQKCFVFLLFCFLPSGGYADENCFISLYSYTGYLTTPSAYIRDGHWGVHYSYFPKDAGAFYGEVSDNKIFSSSLGFFPFIECYFSVFVTPQIEDKLVSGIDHNTRSAGFKMRLLQEKKWLPSTAIGIFDPDTRKAGLKYSFDNVSSTFLVLSKHLGYSESSISIGYGFKALTGTFVRLRGFFCGASTNLTQNVTFLVDYDSEQWCSGINARYRGIDIVIAYIEGNYIAYRAGYTVNLL